MPGNCPRFKRERTGQGSVDSPNSRTDAGQILTACAATIALGALDFLSNGVTLTTGRIAFLLGAGSRLLS